MTAQTGRTLDWRKVTEAIEAIQPYKAYAGIYDEWGDTAELVYINGKYTPNYSMGSFYTVTGLPWLELVDEQGHIIYSAACYINGDDFEGYESAYIALIERNGRFL